MEKESFILYNSFYEPIKALKNEQLGKLLRAIFDYTINGEITQEGDILIAFMFIKNQIDRDSEKWEDERNKRKEAGRLGGIKRALNQQQKLSSKSKQCLGMLESAKQSQANQADNVDVYVDVDVDDNVNNNINTTTDIYNYISSNYNRLLSPNEIYKIQLWLSEYNEEMIKKAIEISCLQNIKTFSYAEGILKNWKGKGYKTIGDLQNEEKVYNNEPKKTKAGGFQL